MVTLSLCFVLQFIIAIACLAVVSVDSQADFLKSAWMKLSDETINETQNKFNCCGFSSFDDEKRVACPKAADKPCFEVVKDSVTKALQITGIVGLIFSFINVSLVIYVFFLSV